MTTNQVAYQRNLEEARHNLVMEDLERSKLGLSTKELELKGYLNQAQVSYYQAQSTAAEIQAEASRQNALTNMMDAATRRMSAESGIKLNEANINRINQELQISWAQLTNDTIRAKAAQTQAYASLLGAYASQANAQANLQNAETNRKQFQLHKWEALADVAFNAERLDLQGEELGYKWATFGWESAYGQAQLEQNQTKLELEERKLDQADTTIAQNEYRNKTQRTDVWLDFANGLINNAINGVKTIGSFLSGSTSSKGVDSALSGFTSSTTESGFPIIYAIE